MAYITGYCQIRNRQLAYQGEVILKDQRGNLDTFLDTTLTSLSISYPKFYKMDHLSKLGFLAAEVLLKDVNLQQVYEPSEIALVLSNANASLDTDVRYFESTKTMASPALFVYTLTNIVAGEICIRHGIKGENAFFVTPAFNPVQLHSYVKSVMMQEKTKACIAGWIDVLGEHHDVFLYLVEKTKSNTKSLDHSAEQLQTLYQAKYGTVDGRS
ncbi:MAG: hypothetical protein C0490_05995 [Marivirga sp.]|nr:hypothetical protein [Marivirga sp.]